MSENQKQYVEKVLKEYTETESKPTKIDELRTLVAKSIRPSLTFSLVFGIVGALILGFGMSVAMEVIFPGLIWLGIIVGVVGIAMVSVNYFIYKKMLAKGKAKYASQIQELSKELLGE